ncbi:small ubiquitin-related modifier 1-like [Typha angustifolia]|uniref:small ubiquitin-related modifier 1-like n=1 Tax=Typha angustifolia TaxID=59011 RepID=UPI003C2C7FD5
MSKASKESKKQQAGQSPHIKLKIKNSDGNEVFYKIRPHAKLRKIMELYCQRMSMEYDATQFLFDEKLLRGDQTPEELGLEDEDEINAFPHQLGGS